MWPVLPAARQKLSSSTFFLPCELCCMLFGYLFHWLQRKKICWGGYSSVDLALFMQVPVWPAPTVLVDICAGIFWRTLLHIDKEDWQQQVELLVCYSHGHAAVVQRCTAVLRRCTSIHWGLASTEIKTPSLPSSPWHCEGCFSIPECTWAMLWGFVSDSRASCEQAHRVPAGLTAGTSLSSCQLCLASTFANSLWRELTLAWPHCCFPGDGCGSLTVVSGGSR